MNLGWAVLLTAGAGLAAPTFNQDVAPILYEHCASCHRPGEVAPFALLSYADAAKRAGLIAAVTERRFMPPWPPEPGYGEFAHERRLSDAQIRTLKEWAAAGAPEGPGSPPPTPRFAEGWQGGEPDVVLKMPESYQVPADGPDRFICFVLPAPFDRDVYVGGAEFRPGNARVVHHALVMLDDSGRARARAQVNGGSSYPCFGGGGIAVSGMLFGWAPGSMPMPAEPGISRLVPKGTDIVVQIHYHPSGKPEVDQSLLGLKFGDAPTKGVATLLLVNTNIYIPAGATDHRVKAATVLPQDAELFGVFPHAHYLGKEMKIHAHLPDGTTQPLIYIKDWDFNWQGQYRYKRPVKLPKGTRIELEYSYDNSAANPQNPSNPPRPVRWGEQTTDEMAVAFFGVLLERPEDVRGFQREAQRAMLTSMLTEVQDFANLPPEIPPAIRQMLTQLDRNGNGRLEEDELAGLRRLLDWMQSR
jgi:hypothetical protein